MSELRADRFRASLARGEISLQFGSARPGAHEVALERSIALAPATAQRLLSRLREALRAAEGRATAAPAAVAARMGTTLLNAPPADAGERAAHLLQLVESLGATFHHERSFRMAPARLQANRMLLSVDRARLGEGAAARVAEICARLGLPEALRAGLSAQAAGARCVHFGFEGGEESTLYKVYFENARADEEARAAAPGSAVLLHLAHKWDPAQPERCVTTRYEWLPRLDAAGMRERMARAYGAGAPLDAALAVLELAAARRDPAQLQFLEVREDGGPRLSFDLNLYDARLLVRDAQVPLSRLRDHFAVRPGQYQALYDQVRGKPLGHLAGGLHRDGAPFATVYYGVERRG
jgi:tryptophan halogenase